MELDIYSKALALSQRPVLNIRQILYLITLYREPNQALLFKQLQEAMFEQGVEIAKPALTRGLNKLQAAGFIERHPYETDRRGIVVCITDAGRKFVNRLEAA